MLNEAIEGTCHPPRLASRIRQLRATAAPAQVAVLRENLG
jgi:hypothetical protein